MTTGSLDTASHRARSCSTLRETPARADDADALRAELRISGIEFRPRGYAPILGVEQVHARVVQKVPMQCGGYEAAGLEGDREVDRVATAEGHSRQKRVHEACWCRRVRVIRRRGAA